MIDEVACAYRYFLFGFNYQFKQDVKLFKESKNRSEIRLVGSINHILLGMKGLKYRQPGVTTKAKDMHKKSFDIVRFMAKYS